MKFTLALTTLSTKLILLLCVSCMGFLGTSKTAVAMPMLPCHQAMEKQSNRTEPCEMCGIVLANWSEQAVATMDIKSAPTKDLTAVITHFEPDSAMVLELLPRNYQAYYPPPQVLLKAVTPTTKTIVLIV